MLMSAIFQSSKSAKVQASIMHTACLRNNDAELRDYAQIDIQIERQIYRQKDRYTDRKIDIQIERQIYRQKDRYTDRKTDIMTQNQITNNNNNYH